MIGSDATIWATPKASNTPLHGIGACTAPKQQTRMTKSVSQSAVAMATSRTAAPARQRDLAHPLQRRLDACQHVTARMTA